jgi:hypothetical protein
MKTRTIIVTFVATATLGMPAYASNGGAVSGFPLLSTGHVQQLALQYSLDHRSHVGAYKIAQSGKSSNPKGFDATDDERTAAKKKKKGKDYIQPHKKP